jgi:flavin reductase (DIM6/NTAB) family NADH-FMN oxidoreductase RutF
MLFDMQALGPQDTYKLLVATVVPRPIAWVTTLDRHGVRNAAPFSFFNAVSGHPPVVCIGIGGRSPGDAKDTGNNIRTTGQFVVNLVSEETAAAMNVTAIDFGPDVDELTEAGLTTIPSTKVRPPRIAESPVSMECERLVLVDVGDDRTVVLGRVLAMHVRDDCVIDPAKCYIDTPKLGLLGRLHGRAWYARLSDRFELPRIGSAEWKARKRAAE